MSKRLSCEAAAQMHKLAVKAILATGVLIPQKRKKRNAEYIALARSLFPSAQNDSVAAKRLTKLLLGEIIFTPTLPDYNHICSVLGIVAEAASLPAATGTTVAKVSMSNKHKNKRSGLPGYPQCCARFRRKVFCALNELGIPAPNPYERPPGKFCTFLRYAAPTSGDRARLLAFFDKGRPIDPSTALYWRLCHELGIDPNGSGFVYKLKEGVNVEAL